MSLATDNAVARWNYRWVRTTFIFPNALLARIIVPVSSQVLNLIVKKVKSWKLSPHRVSKPALSWPRYQWRTKFMYSASNELWGIGKKRTLCQRKLSWGFVFFKLHNGRPMKTVNVLYSIVGHLFCRSTSYAANTILGAVDLGRFTFYPHYLKCVLETCGTVQT